MRHHFAPLNLCAPHKRPAAVLDPIVCGYVCLNTHRVTTHINCQTHFGKQRVAHVLAVYHFGTRQFDFPLHISSNVAPVDRYPNTHTHTHIVMMHE